MNTQPAPEAPEADRVLHLSELVRRPITDAAGESIGRLDDVVVRLRGAEHPLVIGLVAGVAGKEIFVESDDPDLHAAIDALADKLDRQIIKYKDRRHAHPHDALKHRSPSD